MIRSIKMYKKFLARYVYGFAENPRENRFYKTFASWAGEKEMERSFILFILIPCDVAKGAISQMSRYKVCDSGIVSCGIIVKLEEKGTG